MGLFKPDMYYQDIFSVNYDLLKKKNIEMLIFDIDNTIVKIDSELPDVKVKKLMDKLKGDFKIALASNNSSGRVKKIGNYLDVHAFYKVLKPTKKLKKLIFKKFDTKMDKIAIIGDQFVTDMLMGNRLNMVTVLVDPIENRDLKITFMNRVLERIIMKFMRLKRGNYYEKK